MPLPNYFFKLYATNIFYMKKPRIAAALLFLLALNCFIWPAKAQNLDYYGIESWIQEDTTILNVVTLTFNSSVESMEYKFKARISNVTVESKYAPADCETRAGEMSSVSCDFINYKNYDGAKIEISFLSDEITQKAEEVYEFNRFVPIETGTNRFFNIVYLPPTATLVTDAPNESFTPRNGKTLSDGKHIMVYWDKESVENGEDMYYAVTYRLPPSNMGSIWDIGITVVIAVILIASLGVFYVRTTRKQDSIKVLMPLMKGDEKVVIEILLKHEGSANQKVIVRESDFSKAKVSRIITGLKERGIVEVQSLGRTNKITLKIKK